MTEKSLLVSAPRKGGIIFDQTKPNHPRSRHEQLKQAYARLLELGVIRLQAFNALTGGMVTVAESVVNDCPAVALVKKEGVENSLWNSIKGEEFFSPDERGYLLDGVEYKDVVPEPIMIKGFGGIKMAVRSESINDKIFYYSFFVDSNKKPWRYKTLESAVRCNRTILKNIFKGRELSDKNQGLFQEAVEMGKIVFVSVK